MCFITSLKREISKHHMSQKEFGKVINASQTQVSRYLNLEIEIPQECAMKAVQYFKSPELLAEYAEEYGRAFFNIPVLDMADQHPMTVLEFMVEESSEAIKAVQVTKRLIRNKNSKEDLSNEEYDLLMDQMEQMADLFVTLQMLFISMRRFGVLIKAIERRIREKMFRKGYKKRTAKKAAKY